MTLPPRIDPQPASPCLSAEGVTRRRLMVRKADHENLLEDAVRNPDTNPIVDAFIRGEIDVPDLIPRLRALRARPAC